MAENIARRSLDRGQTPTRQTCGAITNKAEQFLAAQNIHLDPRQKVSRLTAAQKQEVMIARALYAGAQRC